ncbi:MAG: CRISPR-associated helicase Cas3' [Anaerolineaceae bacterium]|nr:CRISPR-associated helicase Cas3' [Anaerolineaceae bacterium]
MEENLTTAWVQLNPYYYQVVSLNRFQPDLFSYKKEGVNVKGSTSYISDPFWGKYAAKDPSNWHSLLNHMLDTAAVCLALWETSLSDSFKKQISEYIGLDVNQTNIVLAFWVALHDIGKLGPGFQRKNDLIMQALTKQGFTFPEPSQNKSGFHGTATTIILMNLLKELEPGMPRSFRNSLALALGGHHGEFPNNGEVTNYGVQRDHVGDMKWQEAQRIMYTIIKDIFKPADPLKYPCKPQEINPFFLLLSGLTSTADWIASNADFFSYQRCTTPQVYFDKAKEKAKNALCVLGWTGWQASHSPLSFKELFPEIQANTQQEGVISLSDKLSSPFLAIIEAQTGSGKTESALYIADCILQRENKSGFYIAMPTQATSNQMFSRLRHFLSKRYSENQINLHLVHGKAMLGGLAKPFEPEAVFAEGGEEEGNIQSHAWFLPRKRTLLAPFGVGTVDQTFLAVLRSRHFFIRLFGLSHKIVIFDEVHAYDVYMGEIFKTLLQWLRAVGSSVVILTATLPESKRLEFLKTYADTSEVPTSQAFPRVSIASGNTIQVLHSGEQSSRSIDLEWIDRDPLSTLKSLKSRLTEGGCAAVICNTVKRSQEIYAAIKSAFKEDETEIILFHSRFPFVWRKEIEEKILKMFGKDRSHRPYKAILVATQVIEQSLDLDFDLLLTDLAPIDLLIQRIGRLQRHLIPGSRPTLVCKPTCMISAYPSLEETLSEGSDVFVYEPYILGKTWSVLKGRKSICLPLESDAFISEVYENTANDNELLSRFRNRKVKEEQESQNNAHNYLIPGINKEFMGTLPNFFGDDPSSLSKTNIPAPTREFEPSIQVVCFEQKTDGLYPLGSQEQIDLNKALNLKQIQRCLNAELTLTDKSLVHYLLNTVKEVPLSFRRTAALRWHFPLIFTEDRCKLGEYEIIVEKEAGLYVHH